MPASGTGWSLFDLEELVVDEVERVVDRVDEVDRVDSRRRLLRGCPLEKPLRHRLSVLR